MCDLLREVGDAGHLSITSACFGADARPLEPNEVVDRRWCGHRRIGCDSRNDHVAWPKFHRTAAFAIVRAIVVIAAAITITAAFVFGRAIVAIAAAIAITAAGA